ncbi:acyltransferase [Shewanella sp. SM34]|uniref:acyltransferase n=1 Tax=unclassified Shewanella TaxID=196818 RepID=UPI0021DB606A|nr:MULTISPECIES: acyltransferase [unclassified Shewanella]MCU8055566.1 acyltransferase [Shewanella sp. SM35]MCU8064488.1 acyltransferase [Shewanella sp. SM34]
MFKKILYKVFILIRKFIYFILSDFSLSCNVLQPVLCFGFGNVKIHKTVTFGVVRSPGFFSGASYLDLREKGSYIEIGKYTVFNNNLKMISDGKSIVIGEYCLFGYNFEVIDSDFHGLGKDDRRGNKSVAKKDVRIGNNVLVGNNVTVLKGVTIGDNSVIANGSVVTRSVESDVIVGGNPAKLIRKL